MTAPDSQSRHYTQSSSFIMALIFTVLCGLAALSLGYFIHYFAKDHLIESTEAFLDAEIRYLDVVGYDAAQMQKGLYIKLREDAPLPAPLSKGMSRMAEGILVFDHPNDGKRYAAKIHTMANGQAVVVGKDITTISRDFNFMQLLGLASIVFVILVVLVAFIISIFVVDGTNKIATTAREIIRTGDLSRRVEVGSRWDDLGNMAIVLNMLLARVEQLMHGVRQVSDNVAHDLRTPLTRMRGRMEALPDGADKTVLMEEADHLLTTFNALLRISRIEAEQCRGHFQTVNLKGMLEDLHDYYEPLADQKSIILSLDVKAANVQGDRDLLFKRTQTFWITRLNLHRIAGRLISR